MRWVFYSAVSFLLFFSGVIAHQQNVVTDFLYLIGAKSYVYNHAEDREVAELEDDVRNRVVLLTMGQSNAANHGEGLFVSDRPAYNYFDGVIYKAKDPLLGGSGVGGSIWLRLAGKITSIDHDQQVLIVPVAIGGTMLADWLPNGKHHPYLSKTLSQLKKDDIKVTYVIWQQGESDNSAKTSSLLYKKQFSTLVESIRRYGVDAPIYISQTSLCGRDAANDEIRSAQIQIPQMTKGVEAGLDTDLLGYQYRYDGCHFSTEGLELLAERWYELIFN